MNIPKMPGFTADKALYQGGRQFHAVAFDNRKSLRPGITPQACILLDGQLECGFPNFPVNKPDPEIRCRVECVRKFRFGPKLTKCLSDC